MPLPKVINENVFDAIRHLRWPQRLKEVSRVAFACHFSVILCVMLTYNSVFEILKNEVRLKETTFNFLPLSYKRGRKIGLTLGDLVTDFLPFKKTGCSSPFFFFCFLLIFRGKIGRWLKMVKLVSHIRCRFLPLPPSAQPAMSRLLQCLHPCTHNVRAVPTPMLSHVRHICGAFSVLSFFRSKVKTEASYPRKNKMGSHFKVTHSL